MKRIFVTISIIITLIAAAVFYVYAFDVKPNAQIASIKLCDWLSTPNSNELFLMGNQTRSKLGWIKKEYGGTTKCELKHTKFNGSPFETSIMVSSQNIELIGLRYGIAPDVKNRSFKYQYLGYWTP